MTLIETTRLRLRDFLPADLNDYHQQIYNDPDVTRYLPGSKPRPLERTKEVLDFSIEHGQKHGFSLWAVLNKADNQFLGHCGLIFLQDAPEVELAYALGKSCWGKGLASEAARACLRYGFETAELKYVLALADPANLASQRVMQKIGMRDQGMTDAYYRHKLVLYWLNHADWKRDDTFYYYNADSA